MKVRMLRFLALLVLLNASSCMPASEPGRHATAEAISLAVRSTLAAESLNATRPQEAVETAQAEATSVSQQLQATQAALNAFSASGQAATQAAAAPIRAELPRHGVDPAQGRLGWIHPPLTLEVSGYRRYG